VLLWEIGGCGGFVVTANRSRLKAQEYSPAKAQRRKVLPHFQGFSLRLCAFAGEIPLGMVVAKCHDELRSLERKLIMKTVVSFLLGAVMLFGAATLGLQSATANAKDKHDKNYWKHHHHRHHKHHHQYKTHLSY